MRSLPLRSVTVTDPFWSRWQKVLVETSLPLQFKHIVETGRLKNFHRAAGKAEGDFEGLWFNDSDVYKWVEACAFALALNPSDVLKAQVDETIEAIVAAQEPNGYLNTFFQVRHPDMKWRNLHMMHEMYCGGHLIEAAVAMSENLGDDRLLAVAKRFADHVMSVFGPGLRVGYCGHEEFELALIKMAALTGESKYRDYARWQVEQRGSRPSPMEAEMHDEEACKLWPGTNSLLKEGEDYHGEYCQDHAPIRQHTSVVGHAVRAMYYYIAAADLSDGLNDEALQEALVRVWESLTKRRMYVTGGIGPSASNEGFTTDYDLPNLTAYAETCAAIGLAFWGHKMLEVTGESSYADTMERAIYNGSLAGISLAGDKYFYVNPLESRGKHERVPWFSCSCCPPNIARLIASISRYSFGVSDDAVYIHMPVSLTTEVSVNGIQTKINIDGNYPWSSSFKVMIDPQSPVEFELRIRIPDWSEDASLDVPQSKEEAGFDSGYMVLKRKWAPGDVATVDFGMVPKWVEADPRVKDNLGRSALTYGPLIYAAEAHDQSFAPQLFTADTTAETVVEASDMLEGITTIEVPGIAEVESFVDELYAEDGTTESVETTLKMIPYYAWNNRGATDMQVWVRRI